MPSFEGFPHIELQQELETLSRQQWNEFERVGQRLMETVIYLRDSHIKWAHGYKRLMIVYNDSRVFIRCDTPRLLRIRDILDELHKS